MPAAASPPAGSSHVPLPATRTALFFLISGGASKHRPPFIYLFIVIIIIIILSFFFFFFGGGGGGGGGGTHRRFWNCWCHWEGGKGHLEYSWGCMCVYEDAFRTNCWRRWDGERGTSPFVERGFFSGVGALDRFEIVGTARKLNCASGGGGHYRFDVCRMLLWRFSTVGACGAVLNVIYLLSYRLIYSFWRGGALTTDLKLLVPLGRSGWGWGALRIFMRMYSEETIGDGEGGGTSPFDERWFRIGVGGGGGGVGGWGVAHGRCETGRLLIYVCFFWGGALITDLKLLAPLGRSWGGGGGGGGEAHLEYSWGWWGGGGHFAICWMLFFFIDLFIFGGGTHHRFETVVAVGKEGGT